MLVSTTVVSTRIRRPCATRWSRTICTILSWICLTTAGPTATAHGLGVGHLRPADPGEVAVHQIGAYLALEHAIAPVADVLEDQQAQHHLRRRTQSAAAAALGMALAEGLVHGRYHLLICQHLIGVPHPVFAQIAHLFGDQAVAEAALCTPHLNHVACAGTLTPRHPGAAVHD